MCRHVDQHRHRQRNISQANVSGTDLPSAGLSLPATLSPGQSAAVTVTFQPEIGKEAASGALSVASDASNSRARDSSCRHGK